MKACACVNEEKANFSLSFEKTVFTRGKCLRTYNSYEINLTVTKGIK